jgi:hypothetical protein
MAKGGGAAANQLNTTNAIGAQQQGTANTLQNQLIPGYTSLMNTGYLNPQQQGAATTSEMGAATAPFSTAQFQANNTAAATNNASDLGAQQDQLALSEGQTAGGAAANLQNQQMQSQLAGMYGLSQEQAASQGEAQGMYGLGPGTLNAQANLENAANNQFSSIYGPLISAGGSIGAAAAGKG